MDIKTLVDRFLAWPLPKTVASDGCATNPDYPHPRSGTNLLTAKEAEAMLVYVLGLEDEFSLDAPASEPKALTDGDVYTLIGHAHVLRGDGEEDMPKWFMELALRMAIIIGDNALADRVRALQEQP